MMSTLSNITAGVQTAGEGNRPVLQPSSWLQDLNIAIEAAFPALAFIFVALRVFVRGRLRTFGWGELTLTPSLLWL